MSGEKPPVAGANEWTSLGRLSASERFRAKSGAMGRAVTLAAVEAAQVRPGMRALDLASGTGEPAISLASAGAEVTGIDINGALLEIARERARARSLDNVRFQVADAQALPFASGTFDVVTSRLGVMFFHDPVQAMREARRVLVPGGRVALIAWGAFDQPYFSATAGTLLQMFPDPAFQPPAMFRFARPGSLSAMLQEAGFADARDELRTVDWSWSGSAAEVWEYFREVTAPLRPLFARVPPDRVADADAAVVRAIERYRRGDRIEFGAQIVVATATRPA